MMKRLLKRVTSLVISLALLVPMTVSFATAEEIDPTSKIDEVLIEKMEENTGCIQVNIKLVDFKEQFTEEYGEEIRFEESDYATYSEWFNEYYKPRQQLYYELFDEYIQGFMTEMGYSEDKIVENRIIDNEYLIVNLTNEEIYETVANEKVYRVYDLSASPYVTVFEYTTEDAVHILRASVGLEYFDIFRDDPNRDGVYDVADAVLVLRSVIGLDLIIWPAEMDYPG